MRLDPLLTGRGLEVDDLLYAANGVCPCGNNSSLVMGMCLLSAMTFSPM